MSLCESLCACRRATFSTEPIITCTYNPSQIDIIMYVTCLTGSVYADLIIHYEMLKQKRWKNISDMWVHIPWMFIFSKFFITFASCRVRTRRGINKRAGLAKKRKFRCSACFEGVLRCCKNLATLFFGQIVCNIPRPLDILTWWVQCTEVVCFLRRVSNWKWTTKAIF